MSISELVKEKEEFLHKVLVIENELLNLRSGKKNLIVASIYLAQLL